ncbi:MAG: hypothetical protein HYV47_02455 [Candidatus Nealsonbacteria bacterium]|nr:hypothetical protein [Candidatus Nealsonbacteria bacterium]
MLQTFNGNKGISIIEILVVIAILAVTLTTLLGLINFSLRINDLSRQTTQANGLAQEAMEAVRSIRDNAGWQQIANGNHGLINTAGKWSFSGTENITGGFTRMISIQDAYRDAGDNIVASGGTADLDTKKITASVSWSERSQNHNIEIITHLTNWK